MQQLENLLHLINQSDILFYFKVESSHKRIIEEVGGETTLSDIVDTKRLRMDPNLSLLSP